MYNLVDSKDPILHKKVENFCFSTPSTCPVLLFENMKKTLINLKGLGLSCNQVGLEHRMCVIGDYNYPDGIFSIFNPRIVNFSEKKSYLMEGCLSYTGLFFKIKRADSIRVRFTDHAGVTDTMTFAGLTAHIIQHEVDHLNGITFKERTNLYHYQQGMKKYSKFLKKSLTK